MVVLATQRPANQCPTRAASEANLRDNFVRVMKRGGLNGVCRSGFFNRACSSAKTQWQLFASATGAEKTDGRQKRSTTDQPPLSGPGGMLELARLR
jgi:hypothetical protein